jgi:IclR family acetate operon transcriptional repressor
MIGATCTTVAMIISRASPRLRRDGSFGGPRGENALSSIMSSTRHRHLGQTGEHVPTYCSAHGKALLADFEEADLRAFLGDKPLKVYTKKTINTIKGLTAACAEIKKKGYATDAGEYLQGVRCVASPIRHRDGAVIGSLNLRPDQDSLRVAIPTAPNT